MFRLVIEEEQQKKEILFTQRVLKNISAAFWKQSWKLTQYWRARSQGLDLSFEVPQRLFPVDAEHSKAPLGVQ